MIDVNADNYPHVAAGLRYAEAVLSGEIDACKWVKAACQRQLDDLELQGTDWQYRFDLDRAEHICKFVELMPHIKGEWANRGESIQLHPSQQFKLSTIFGWVHRLTGHRRFRMVYDERPRKNGKSIEAAAVANYMLTADGEAGAEVWSAATTRDQAGIVFKTAKAMARRSPGFRSRYGVNVHAHALSVTETESTFQALSSDAHNLDGLNPHFASVDELHAHRTREVYDVLETAMGARSQPLLWCVTTAGFDRSGICYEVRSYLTKVLNTTLHAHDGLGHKVDGTTATDDTIWGIIYTIDDDDDWTDPAVWAKANPLLGVSVREDDMARLARKAQEMPSAVNNFLTKRLNVWVNADVSWMDMRAWDACADAEMSIDNFDGETAIVGVDLASRKDVASTAAVFRRMIDEESHYYVFARHYLPEETVEASANAQYSGWARQGLFELTDGSIIDFDLIEEDIRDDASRFRIYELAIDPHQATQFNTHMQGDGFDVVEVRPLVLNFSEPMKELEALVISGRLHHTGDPVLTWMISNVVGHYDRKGNIYPTKERDTHKIDGVIALLMALNRWMRYQDTPVITGEIEFV